MPTPEKQVRVFISSTFRDMHAERDHLVTVVFPELRERVERLGLEFFDVDLRWGVPERGVDGERANSWAYCKQWIDRVKPFFICMLGQRYGWTPPSHEIKDDDERVRYSGLSVTEMEIRHAVLSGSLRRRSFFYFRSTHVPITAPAEVFAEFVDASHEGQLRALKEEIRGNSGRPVRDYTCHWTGTGFAGMEEFGRRVLDDLWSGVLRDECYVSKEVWQQALGKDPDTDPSYTDEVQPIPRELAEKIAALAKPEPKDPLDAEREQMEAFAATRLRWFQGRTEELQQLTDFINSTDEKSPRLAAVVAAPGQGKSALLAKLSTFNFQHSTFLITHFVGATERSASAYSLVERLLGELDRSGIAWPAEQQEEGQEPKRDFNSLCLRLVQRLGDYAGERRIVILLDALNQLSDGHDLQWLPYRLGPSVRVIVSCVEDTAAKADATAKEETPERKVLRAIDLRQSAPLRVALSELNADNVRTIVEEYLHEYCKELDTPYVNAICAMPQARNPLYLLVMLGELRTLGGNDMNRIVPALVASMPQDHPDTVSLFRWVLQRLEEAEGFGKAAVQWWCLYLAHGRVGMASRELADLLARKLGPDGASTALRIERGLRRYLLRRGPQLDFFHGQLRQAAMAQYGPHPEAVAVHGELTDYFTACAKGTAPQREWETDCVRGFSECVYHLTKADRHHQAATLLANFPFLLHKLRVGLLEGVFEDYDKVQVLRAGSARRTSEDLQIWADFFREKAHILRRGNDAWPAHKILLQLAVEHADDSPLTIGAEKWLAEDHGNWLWLRRVPRLPSTQKSPCVAVLEGHAGSVNGALVLANNGLLSWSDDKTLRTWDGQSGECLKALKGHTGPIHGALILSDGRLLSWAGWNDNTLRLWDGKSGACLKVLVGHTDSVNGVLALADGRLLSWAGWNDKTLRVWEGKSGACLKVLEGHTSPVDGALLLADGRLLSWAQRDDNTLRLWDTARGACLKVLRGHTDWVRGALVLAGGRLLSWSDDKTLRLWDGETGACLKVLRGHASYVGGALALADRRLLSWSNGEFPTDSMLRLWDVESGTCQMVLQGHSRGVFGALPLADGRLLSWSDDKTLRVWDAGTGASLKVLEGHTSYVRGALELADGRILSRSVDGTLRLWDGRNGGCLAVQTGHTASVDGMLELADGRLLSWSSDHSSRDDTLRLWDGHAGQALTMLPGHSTPVSGALPVAVGNIISFSRMGDRNLRLWDARSGVCLKVLEGHTHPPDNALTLADGNVLSWENETLRLWNGYNGQCLAVLTGHSSVIWHAFGTFRRQHSILVG